MQPLADLLARKRWILALTVAAVSGLALVGVTRLRVDDVPRNLFRTDNDEFAQLEQLYRDFGADDNDCMLVVVADELFAPPAVAALREMVAHARAIEGVRAVYSLVDTIVFEAGQPPRSLLPPVSAPPEEYARARREALDHPVLAGQLIAPDGRTMLVIVRLDEARIAISDMAPVIDRLRSLVQRVDASADLSVRLTGLPVIRVEIYLSIPREQAIFMTVGAALGAVIGFVLFRSWAAIALVMIGGTTGALWSLGAMGWLGLEMNVLSSVLPTLVMVIGFTDAVHLIYDMRASRRTGTPALEASCNAIRHLGPACALTSLTTAIGFGSLALAGVPIIRGLGLACAVGVGVTLAAVLLLIPLLASTRIGTHIERRSPSTLAVRISPYCRRWMGTVTRHGLLISVLGTMVTLGLVASALQLEPNSWLTEAVPTGGESALAIAHCDEAFGGVAFASMVLEWPEHQTLASPNVLACLAEMQQLFADESTTRNPISVQNLLAVLPGTSDDLAQRVPLLQLVPEDVLHRFVRPELRRAVVTAHVPDIGTAAFEPVLADLENGLTRLGQRYPEMKMSLTGTSPVAVRQLNAMIRDLAASLGFAAVVIFAVMTVAFRSLRLGLLTVLPNVFPLAVTAAVLVWTGRYLQLTSVIVFTICLGVAVDDTVHFVMRFRRELRTDDNIAEALTRTFMAVGAALVTTTAILVAGFSTVFLSQMPTNRHFAALACIALIAALIGDLILLPALLACFGRSKTGCRPPMHAPETDK
ncbi:MAG: MMPL family transporter [Planctomycetes bacterium]|nr:MMPL family transporter [Planctomycetota bacterium]